MNKLTIEHLAIYLPYGVKMQVMREDGNHDIITLNASKVILVVDGYYCSTEKLILRPLSDLTKQIEHNGKHFVPISAILERFGDSESLENALLWLMNGSYPYFKFSYCIIELLISWHFDVFALIMKGLAIGYNTVKGD